MMGDRKINADLCCLVAAFFYAIRVTLTTGKTRQECMSCAVTYANCTVHRYKVELIAQIKKLSKNLMELLPQLIAQT
jgi:hypothetical protein